MNSKTIRLEIKTAAVIAKRQSLFARAQAAFDTQVLKDSNLFAPKADNFLRASGRVDRPGVISWNMPYARRQYYLDDEVKGEITYTTPGTMAKWFEHAKARFKKDWAALMQRMVK